MVDLKWLNNCISLKTYEYMEENLEIVIRGGVVNLCLGTRAPGWPWATASSNTFVCNYQYSCESSAMEWHSWSCNFYIICSCVLASILNFLSPQSDGYEDNLGLVQGAHQALANTRNQQVHDEIRDPQGIAASTTTILPLPTATAAVISSPSPVAHQPSLGGQRVRNRQVGSDSIGGQVSSAFSSISTASLPQSISTAATGGFPQHGPANARQAGGNVIIASSSVPRSDVLNSSHRILLPQGQAYTSARADDNQPTVYRQA